MPMLIALLMLLVAELADAATLADQVAAMQPGAWSLVATANTAAAVDPARDPATNEKCRQLGKVAPCTAVVPYYSGYAADNRALFSAWNGGALSTLGSCGTLLYVGGGHADYWGNEVVGLDLCGDGDAPVWKRLSDPYNPPAKVAVENPNGAFPDGSMSPAHNYGGLAWLNDFLFVINGQSCKSAGLCASPQYDKSAWVWRNGKYEGPFPHLGAKAGSAAADTYRNVIWFQVDVSGGTSGEFSRFDPATNTTTFYGRPNVGGLEQMMGYDPDSDRLVLFTPTTRKLYERNPANPTGPWVLATQVGAPALSTDYQGGPAMSWSKRLKAWVVFMGATGDARVYKVQRTAPLQYTWSVLSAAGATPPVTAVQNGLFGKYQVVETAAGEVLVGTHSLTAGVWAFRIPGTEVAQVPSTGVVRLPCSSPGVFICESFTEAPTRGALLASAAGTRPRIEDGTLAFDIPSLSGSDAGGKFSAQSFSPIGEGQTIAWSYRVKADRAMNTLPAPGWKQFILWRGAASCTDLEISLTHGGSANNVALRPLLVPYTHCGARSFQIPLANYDYLLHYPDFDCRYHTVNKRDLSKCAVTEDDTWQDYYFEVTVGHYGQPDTKVVMWTRTLPGPWRRFVERSDYVLSGSGGFNNFMLTVYMTRKDATVENPPAKVWYDNLVLSRQPFFADLKG
jgi:hypothetical protein